MGTDKALEGGIRKALVEADLIDCIVNMPAKLFLNTQILASLWFMSRVSAGSAPEYEDDFDFAERFVSLKGEFEAQLIERIQANLQKVRITD